MCIEKFEFLSSRREAFYEFIIPEYATDHDKNSK